MIEFKASTAEDQPRIISWVLQDPFHVDQGIQASEGWWLTNAPGSLLVGRVDDEHGPAMYFRLDPEKDCLIRLSIQFAPMEEVGKLRVARLIAKGMPVLIQKAKEAGAKGFVFESQSPALGAFMARYGFRPMPGKENIDDYICMFEEK
jgi:hypothetical protein